MEKQIQYVDDVTIRFAGDSGDGMQLTGTQFSNATASVGTEVNTLPDYPSEIRAPEGTLYGVSSYQVHFGSHEINTPGDTCDVLVAMNASALKVNLPNVKKNGIIIANTAGFCAHNLELAKYDSNPLEDSSLESYRVFAVDITKHVLNVVADLNITKKNAERTKNIFALGLTYWLFDLPMDPTIKWLSEKFAKKIDILQANLKVLQAGWNYGLSTESLAVQYHVKPSTNLKSGSYRNITGNHATALGLVAASVKAKLPLFYGSYPITPATDILQYLSNYRNFGVKTFQFEDEIGGIVGSIGAAFGGALACTGTSGPGLSLKIEALGLAQILELPLVIVDVQRAGPSTGMPTKSEQADLFQAMYGRHGESPLPVIAATTSWDCFNMAFKACQIALKYMTPVILLTDSYVANGAEPFRIPEVDELPDIDVKFHTDPSTFKPYKRNETTLARPWAIPGTPELEHRIGGLEKDNITGAVNYAPLNHEKMCALRAEKIQRIQADIPDIEVKMDEDADILVVGWGSTRGAIKTACAALREDGKKIAYIYLRYLNPFPKNLGEILNKYKKVVMVEENSGMLRSIVRDKFLIDIEGVNKVQGQPFKGAEIQAKLEEIMKRMEESK